MHFLRKTISRNIASKFSERYIVTSKSSNSDHNVSEWKPKKPILYGDEASPPVRFVLMAASILNYEMEFRKVDLFQGENKLELYKKINPLMKVPSLATKNEVIRDSHAIALHMCRITENQDLYPNKDLIRDRVDDFLFFNASALFPVDSSLMTEYFDGKWPLNPDLVANWNFLIDYLETCLKEKTWLVGDTMTLSDICCVATVTSAALLIPIPEKCVNIHSWINKLKEFTFYGYNASGLKRLNKYIDQLKISNCNESE